MKDFSEKSLWNVHTKWNLFLAKDLLDLKGKRFPTLIYLPPQGGKRIILLNKAMKAALNDSNPPMMPLKLFWQCFPQERSPEIGLWAVIHLSIQAVWVFTLGWRLNTQGILQIWWLYTLAEITVGSPLREDQRPQLITPRIDTDRSKVRHMSQ